MTRFSKTAVVFAAFIFGLSAVAQEATSPQGDGIDPGKISALQKEFAEAGEASSSIRKRRAFKSLARDGEKLIEASPAAPNRWRVLEIIFQSQKSLLALENSDRNREALFATSNQLAGAPDEFADLRLEAEMLLSERDLSAKNADLAERTAALAALIARYRDTPGEAKSLMMGSLIAPKLEAFDLEKQIFGAMDDRFAGDYDLIEWRRKTHGYAHERVLFTGTFERVGGGSLTFPIDGIGHTCVMVFWSKDTPEIATHLAKIKDLQTRFPGWIDIFSLNVDGLADGGVKTLRALGLDWTALPASRGKEEPDLPCRREAGSDRGACERTRARISAFEPYRYTARGGVDGAELR